jgi:hypothetical protein
VSKEHGSQIKDEGRRQCCHNKLRNFSYHVMYLFFPDIPRMFGQKGIELGSHCPIPLIGQGNITTKKTTWPWVFRWFKAPGFLDNRHIKLVRLSALRTVRLYPKEYPGTHFEKLNQPWAKGFVGCPGKIPHWHERGRSGALPNSSEAH